VQFPANIQPLDKKTRTSALNSLRNLLSARQTAAGLTTLDILKLWKGLFYALWMCDRPIPQQALCADLAALIHVLPDAAVVPWLRGFWATVAREWAGIDALRLNKFLLLVRRVLGEGLLWMKVPETEGAQGEEEKMKKNKTKAGKKGNGSKAGRGDAEKVDGILGLLGEWPFVLEDEARAEKEAQERQEDKEETDGKDSLSTQYVPVGLKIHVLDIWVDEAEKVGLFEDDEDTEARDIVRRITELVQVLEKGTMSTAIRIRSKQSLMDDRLPGNDKADEEDEDSD